MPTFIDEVDPQTPATFLPLGADSATSTPHETARPQSLLEVHDTIPAPPWHLEPEVFPPPPLLPK